MQLEESNLRQKEVSDEWNVEDIDRSIVSLKNENQIRRLQNELEELIAAKQEIVKSNYILVQNAESLREQLRMFVRPEIRFEFESIPIF